MPQSNRQARFRRLERDRFDVIVVGAGIGGLTTAALLAQRGKSVLVVDQHYVAGGSATIFKRPDYQFDIGIHYLGECGPEGALRRILNAAGIHDVDFVPMDPDGFDTLIFPDLRFRVPRGIDAYRQRLCEFFPRDVQGIDRYIALLAQAPNFVGEGLAWATRSLSEFLDTCTSNAELRAVLAAESGNYGQPPSRASVAVHMNVMAHYLLEGGYFPRGGGQVMSDRLADHIEAHGGKVLLSSRVERILTEAGQVQGVELWNKHLGTRRVHAERVISNADIKTTLLRLVKADDISSELLDRARRFEMSPGIATAYIGATRSLLDAPATNYWIYPGYDIEEPYQATRVGQFSKAPFAYVSMSSWKDPENLNTAPEGVINLQIMTVAPSNPDAWGATEAEHRDGSYRKNSSYVANKDRLTDYLLTMAEQALPGLRKQVVFREMSTPLTHWRYTLASGGTSYGIASTPEQSLRNRPSHITPIRGLYLCGASTRTGLGIMGSMASGVMAASAIVGPQLLREVFG